MNTRRGLIRLWIVISLIYGAVFLWVGVPIAVSSIKTLNMPYQPFQSTIPPDSPEERRDRERERVLEKLFHGDPDGRKREAAQNELRARSQLAKAGVVPPTLFWMLLYVGFWIARGFKGKQ